MNSHLKCSNSCEYKLFHEIFQVFNNSSKIALIKLLLGLWCLTPLSTIFQLYRDGKFYWWRKPDYPEKTIDLPQVTDTLSHNVVKSTPRLSGIQTHKVSGDMHWLHKLYVILHMMISKHKIFRNLQLKWRRRRCVHKRLWWIYNITNKMSPPKDIIHVEGHALPSNNC